MRDVDPITFCDKLRKMSKVISSIIRGLRGLCEVYSWQSCAENTFFMLIIIHMTQISPVNSFTWCLHQIHCFECAENSKFKQSNEWATGHSSIKESKVCASCGEGAQQTEGKLSRGQSYLQN